MHAEAPPTVSSLEDLQDVVWTVERDMLRRYADLAEKMRRGHNPEAAHAFEALAARVRHSDSDGGVARRPREAQGAGILAPNTRIADTPYLMTSYRALRLAVYDEEQTFALYSRIAAETENPAIRAQAESLARNQLHYIAERRLQRRRAFRSQAATAISRAVQDRIPKTPEDIYIIRHEIEATLRDVVDDEFRDLKGKVPEKTASILKRLAQDIGSPEEGKGSADLEAIHATDSDIHATFLALRQVLHEIEAAFEVMIKIVESNASEATVNAALETAQRFVRLLSLIRGGLDELLSA